MAHAVEVALLKLWRSAEWCEDHQRRHTREERQAVLRRLLPAETEEIKRILGSHYACLYGPLGDGTAGSGRLRRDLRAIGAVCVRWDVVYKRHRAAFAWDFA